MLMLLHCQYKAFLVLGECRTSEKVALYVVML